jgi:hypothetical protein
MLEVSFEVDMLETTFANPKHKSYTRKYHTSYSTNNYFHATNLMEFKLLIVTSNLHYVILLWSFQLY